jgi:hypothetical protein
MAKKKKWMEELEIQKSQRYDGQNRVDQRFVNDE